MCTPDAEAQQWRRGDCRTEVLRHDCGAKGWSPRGDDYVSRSEALLDGRGTGIDTIDPAGIQYSIIGHVTRLDDRENAAGHGLYPRPERSTEPKIRYGFQCRHRISSQ